MESAKVCSFRFNSALNFLVRGVTFVIVIERVATGELVAAGTIFIESKIIHSLGKVFLVLKLA